MKKGFTLIELLVVVLIIGILAAVALPQYTKAVERSRTAEAMQRLGDLATAQSIFFMNSNGFAADLTALNAGDITVPELDSGSSFEDVAWTDDNTANKQPGKKMSVKRKSGMYKDAVLSIIVRKDGSIEKGCDETSATNAGLCALAAAGGY